LSRLFVMLVTPNPNFLPGLVQPIHPRQLSGIADTRR